MNGVHEHICTLFMLGKVEREKVEAFKARVRGAEEAAARARQNLSRAANPTFETFESWDQVLDEDVAEDML